jgi:3-oxoacyl-[acyl-carrier-protein] synthase III
MKLVSAGVSFPDFACSSDELASCSTQIGPRERCGVSTVRTSFSQEYLQSSGNDDVLKAWESATVSPTDLGERAISEALKKANLSIDDIGLIMADTATPYQTCPSEAQRIANRFNEKLPAFDLIGGMVAVPLLFSTVSKWQGYAEGKHVVIVSTNTPSQQINYRAGGVERSLLGDAAVAFVLSMQPDGSGRVVRHVSINRRRDSRSPFTVHRFIRMAEDRLMTPAQVRECVRDHLQECCSVDESLRDAALFVPPQLYAREATSILAEEGISAERVVSQVEDNGFSFGAACGVALVSALRLAEDEQRPIVAMHCGDEHVGLVIV